MVTQRSVGTPSVHLIAEIHSGIGGAEGYLRLLGEGLTKRGIRASATVFARHQREGARFAASLIEVMPHVQLETGKFRPAPVVQAIKEHKVDLLHWNFPGPFTFKGGLWLFYPWGRPSVITDHLPMQRLSPPYEVARALANRRIRMMIVVGQTSFDAALAHWRFPPPMRLIYNGVRIVELPEKSQASQIRLLFLNRLTPQKNPLFPLSVVAHLRDEGHDVSYSIVGDGPLRSDVEKAVRERGLGDIVSFHGYIADPEEHLRRADLLLLPSQYESGPSYTPLESLMMGVPVIASDIQANQELSEITEAVRALPPDETAWAEAVLELKKQQQGMRQSARDAALKFSVDVTVDRTIDLYGELIT